VIGVYISKVYRKRGEVERGRQSRTDGRRGCSWCWKPRCECRDDERHSIMTRRHLLVFVM